MINFGPSLAKRIITIYFFFSKLVADSISDLDNFTTIHCILKKLRGRFSRSGSHNKIFTIAIHSSNCT